MSELHSALKLSLVIMALTAPLPVRAANEGRLNSTGGVITVEGNAGGGIVPMAVIAGLSTDPGWDWVGGVSHLQLSDYALSSVGFAASFNDRVELSVGQQRFNIDTALPPGASHNIRQTIVGAKVKLAGDLIYGSLPQISLGAQWKHNRDFELAQLLGADDDRALDVYFGVTRLILDGPFHRNWLINGALRATKGNETGLLGFDDDYEVVGELSTALFFNPEWAIGMEYRQKPHNLAGVAESDWRDVFVAWFPNARVNMVLAYADFGTIANQRDQSGLFLSITGNF